MFTFVCMYVCMHACIPIYMQSLTLLNMDNLTTGTWYGYLAFNEEEYLKIKAAKEAAAAKDKKKKRK